ncbi:unnamed protein product [Acanthoscelides obtectus]|uniref:Uncharacterized protein n=1 Tax=Acanthoscelides obtectus TaxID=200917 RepID=A0A9P0P5Z0_ACAOB|nr:unnamed protein product [Acanthoscelides obtectus]CAK1655503.1 hypothetical protein AOBTE_LOCUS19195 [Acanthoscelides obtectus]
MKYLKHIFGQNLSRRFTSLLSVTQHDGPYACLCYTFHSLSGHLFPG